MILWGCLGLARPETFYDEVNKQGLPTWGPKLKLTKKKMKIKIEKKKKKTRTENENYQK